MEKIEFVFESKAVKDKIKDVFNGQMIGHLFDTIL